jgi:hypothetical protein
LAADGPLLRVPYKQRSGPRIPLAAPVTERPDGPLLRWP